MKKEKRAVFLLLMVSTVFALVCGELVLRVFQVHGSYMEKNKISSYRSMFGQVHHSWLLTKAPNSNDTCQKGEFLETWSTNSLGCADREWDTVKTKHRIACIGDSFTQGVGAPQDSSYSKLLERMVSDSFEVMNWGIAGSDPYFGYMLLKHEILRYKPDIITLTVNHSDYTDMYIRGGYERFREDGSVVGRSGPWWESIYARSYLVRLFVHQVLRYDYMFLLPSEVSAEHKRSEELLLIAIDSISSLAKSNGIPVYFIFHPHLREVEEGRTSYADLLERVRARGYRTIDVGSYFVRNGITKETAMRYYWKYDFHNNRFGYEKFALCLRDSIFR